MKSPRGQGSRDHPDFYLGMSEGQPVHWGGPKRKCYVIDRPRFQETGKLTWRVRVSPPIPEWERSDHRLAEWVLKERFVGEQIEGLGEKDWLTVNVFRYEDPHASAKAGFDAVDLSLEYVGEVALSAEALPEGPDYPREWRRELARIRRFVKAHGHSRFPDPYYDEDGRVDGLVVNLRWHHAGRAGGSPGPFPGVDYAADLDRLEGWSWVIEEPSDIPRLRSKRYEERLIQDLGLHEVIGEVEYIRGVTKALRASEDPPWTRLRELFAENGINAQRAVLADFFPSHHTGYLGVVINPDAQAFAFFLNVGDPEYPAQWVPHLRLSEWRELATPEDRAPYEEQIQLGLQLLKQEELTT